MNSTKIAEKYYIIKYYNVEKYVLFIVKIKRLARYSFSPASYNLCYLIHGTCVFVAWYLIL